MEFDKKFVHCVWDSSLVGKLCVFADDIPCLRKRVEQYVAEYIGVLQESIASVCGTDIRPEDLVFPFCMSDDKHYKFVYYDPNLECKIAHEQGRTIQFRSILSEDGVWTDVDDPMWSDTDEYRVKPEYDGESEYVPYDSVSEMLCDNFNVDNVEDIKNCIWVRPKTDTSVRYMITGIDINQVMIDSIWLNPSQLLDDYLWDDYTAIGK